ncbi:MAG: Dabb family protein, partial [Proteobacteria bacterium]|nr:Dabb family protein [Pseudomonadota bacterium]
GYEYGLVIRFADRPSLDSYQVHPEHQRIVKDLIKPALADILAVDYEFKQ